MPMNAYPLPSSTTIDPGCMHSATRSAYFFNTCARLAQRAVASMPISLQCLNNRPQLGQECVERGVYKRHSRIVGPSKLAFGTIQG
jgi:hypothetical protein